MLDGVISYFWPSVDQKDIKKFSLLSLAFFFIIGTYWMFRLLKDVIFFKIAFPTTLGWALNQGKLFQPYAKMISVFVVIFCVVVYSYLLGKFKKHQLFYLICSFYGLIFTSITVALALRSFYGDAFLGKHVMALVGWGSYFAIESFGSLIISLFWAYTNSVTTSEVAKIGFPIIVAGAQIGSIGGSALTLFADKFGDIWPLFLIGTLFTAAIMAVINHFIKVIPSEQLIGNQVAAKEAKGHKKEGFFQSFFGGLVLLVSRPYLAGVLVISTVYEVVGTIVDFQMKSFADLTYASQGGFANFMGIFGVCANGLAFVMALLGTSYVMKRFGIRVTLLVYPVCFGAALFGLIAFRYSMAPSVFMLTWATFGVMLVVKGLSYAVNNPAKEMMYIPTSKEAKFKAKGWVDMFGGRMSKMGGSQITNVLKHNMENLFVYGSLIGLGIIGFWIVVAFYVGVKNQHLVKRGEIIE